ncbi:glycerate kinase family protein [Thermoflavifilum thermophilum]|uniref:Glycerate kinase n=1 Tax=Thermoflavifilum thermophilum TaxID=1393122 RepID=A0A1I7NLC3_9BACT|nr:glycerate kinase [Thermoflavifilum thermophilum]SFV35443.1 glycerate kinase [Thermoflavifilum thermophilum]
MNILVACNSFKHSLSAVEATKSIARGLHQAGLSAQQIQLFPVADGGDFTADTLQFHLGGRRYKVRCHDPLMRPIHARWLWLHEQRAAMVEMAAASGLRLLQPDELNPLQANTFGTGELILAALNRHPREILIGVGGSATVDGGTGLLMALGAVFLDRQGKVLTRLPTQLHRLHRIDDRALEPLHNTLQWKVLCDVEIPLLGPQGTVARYAPQKGATPAMMARLEEALHRFAEVTLQQTGISLLRHPGAGAAGGVAGGLHAWLGATLLPGADFFLKYTNMDQALMYADLVITGEGKLDAQTLDGKAPLAVAQQAHARHLPVVALAGEIPHHIPPSLQQHFDVIFSIVNGPGSLADHIAATRQHLFRTGTQIGRFLQAGLSFSQPHHSTKK